MCSVPSSSFFFLFARAKIIAVLAATAAVIVIVIVIIIVIVVFGSVVSVISLRGMTADRCSSAITRPDSADCDSRSGCRPSVP